MVSARNSLQEMAILASVEKTNEPLFDSVQEALEKYSHHVLMVKMSPGSHELSDAAKRLLVFVNSGTIKQFAKRGPG